MKNNTKLIMEAWRRFIKEGPDGIDEELPGEPDFDSDVPLEGDDDLENRFADQESEYYPEDSYTSDPAHAHGKDAYSDLPPNYEEDYNNDYYGDPSVQTGPAPMLGMSGDDGEDYETGDSEYEDSGDTFNGMPSEEFYDYSDDSEGDF